MRLLKRLIGFFVFLSLVGGVIAYGLIRPSNDRDWSPDQAVLPEVSIKGGRADIRNVRDIRYRSATEYDVRHADRSYDVYALSSVWYGVEPFKDRHAGMAHTFLTFGFEDGRYLTVSVEIRKEKGEAFSPWKGMFKNYEIMYVIAEERDVVGLRALHRGDDVYLYPLKFSKMDHARSMLISVLKRAEALRHEPEFYNTVFNNCTTNIADHLNEFKPGTMEWDVSHVLPGYSDSYLHKIGLIDTDLPAEAIRERYRVNDRVGECLDDWNFSACIRRPREA